MSDALHELAEHLATQRAEAEQSARLYREAAGRCALLRGGMQRSLDAVRAHGGDFDLEIYLLDQVAKAAQAEFVNLKEAANYEAAAARHVAARGRLEWLNQ